MTVPTTNREYNCTATVCPTVKPQNANVQQLDDDTRESYGNANVAEFCGRHQAAAAFPYSRSGARVMPRSASCAQAQHFLCGTSVVCRAAVDHFIVKELGMSSRGRGNFQKTRGPPQASHRICYKYLKIPN